MKKLMIGAAVAAVALGAVADTSVYNLSMTVKTAVDKSTKGATYQVQGTKKISGVIVDNEVAYWLGSGSTAEYLGEDTYEVYGEKDLGAKGEKTILGIEIDDFDLVGYGSDASLSGNLVGWYDGSVAYGTWSLKQNKTAERKLAADATKTIADVYKFPVGKNGSVKDGINNWLTRTDYGRDIDNATTLEDYQTIFLNANRQAQAELVSAAAATTTTYAAYQEVIDGFKSDWNEFNDAFETNKLVLADWPTGTNTITIGEWEGYDVTYFDMTNLILGATVIADEKKEDADNATFNYTNVATAAFFEATNNLQIAIDEKSEQIRDEKDKATKGVLEEELEKLQESFAATNEWFVTECPELLAMNASNDVYLAQVEFTNDMWKVANGIKDKYDTCVAALVAMAWDGYNAATETAQKMYEYDGSTTNEYFESWYQADWENEMTKTLGLEMRAKYDLVTDKEAGYYESVYGLTEAEYDNAQSAPYWIPAGYPTWVDYVYEKGDYLVACEEFESAQKLCYDMNEACQTVAQYIELRDNGSAEEADLIERLSYYIGIARQMTK